MQSRDGRDRVARTWMRHDDAFAKYKEEHDEGAKQIARHSQTATRTSPKDAKLAKGWSRVNGGNLSSIEVAGGRELGVKYLNWV